MTPYGKNLKILFRKCTWRHRLMLLCSNVVKCGRQEIGRIVRYLPHTQKIRLPLKLLQRRGSRPKSARASPQRLAHDVPNFIQIGSLSAELQPSCRMREGRSFGH